MCFTIVETSEISSVSKVNHTLMIHHTLSVLKRKMDNGETEPETRNVIRRAMEKKKMKKAAGEKRQKGPREGQTEATAISY